jgi:hypothetical protein
MSAGDLSSAGLVLVDPAGCVAVCGEDPRGSGFLTRTARAERRVAVIPGGPADAGYGERDLAADFDAVVEVGLSSPENGRSPSSSPYLFVPDGPTTRERRMINSPKPAERPLPWTLMGANDADHAALASELVEEVAPGGLVLLGEAGDLDGRSLEKVLSRSGCYIWRRREPSGYSESYRYLGALLCGAAPCAIDPSSPPASDTPGFSSVKSLRSALDAGGPGAIYEAARRSYLERENPGAALREVLRA